MRPELRIGFILYAFVLVLNQITAVPEFFMGLFLGLAIFFDLMGILPEKVYCKLKCFKKNFFKKLIK